MTVRINLICLLFLILLQSACNKSSTQDQSSPITGLMSFKGEGFQHSGAYPKLNTCDSTGVSPGLNWSDAPTGTKSFAITMHHYPPTGDKHVYWVVFNIPSAITNIPIGLSGIYSLGINTVNGKNTYAPPCSQGPGIKYYFLTLYALSEAPVIDKPAGQIIMDVLREAIKSKLLDTAVMQVSYTR
jgi:phosphatidylethanolamine-binding protein (PEBP) family uncharacterized protein